MNKKEIDKDLIINTIMNNSQDTVYIKDKNSAIIWSSKSHSRLWGVEDPLEVIGKTDFDYFPYNFAELAYKEEQRIINSEIPIVRRVEKLIKPNGEIRWLSSSKYPFYNTEGEIIGTWGTTKDITDAKQTEEALSLLNLELKEANRQLSILSTKDSLSGLYNQRYFSEQLDQTFEFYLNQKKSGNLKDFSLILLDIDDFKMVNDTYGHLMGDVTITRLSEIMLSNVCQSHICFRYGGDEFAILLLDTDIEEAIRTANNLQKAIAETPIDFKDPQLLITVSMGVASFSHSKDPKDLIRKADKKLYLSKKSGKNKVT
ncbi:MAG TPA: diguanylate cyclase [Epulopiscium sp.]|nr:diguanylate cyclase [Candidatus Epulonipiscium sp.]